ncbi:hypothetical protein BHE74_00005760 [Ensete ventricosum]|nr:hypothetical protein GW17_00011179 [Ensete ventricosum]RWW85544.1 hypothetical protein BHE74_00005760 [Ensete ventricosum]
MSSFHASQSSRQASCPCDYDHARSLWRNWTAEMQAPAVMACGRRLIHPQGTWSPCLPSWTREHTLRDDARIVHCISKFNYAAATDVFLGAACVPKSNKEQKSLINCKTKPNKEDILKGSRRQPSRKLFLKRRGTWRRYLILPVPVVFLRIAFTLHVGLVPPLPEAPGSLPLQNWEAEQTLCGLGWVTRAIEGEAERGGEEAVAVTIGVALGKTLALNATAAGSFYTVSEIRRVHVLRILR